MSNLAVQIILSLRDQLTGPARQAGSAFNQMGQRMRAASTQITAGANQSAAAVNRLGRSATTTSAAIGRLATNMRNMRTLAGGFAGLGLGGGAGLMAAFPLVHMLKNAADYESKLIDIRKVWTGSQEDYESMVAGLKGLHRELPLSRMETGKVLEEGIRAGVSADPKELLDFTRASAAFAVAFTLPIEEAAPKLAKIKSSLGLTVQEFTAVGDTMNTLANTMSTNELEMLEFVRRVGGLAKSIGGSKGIDDVLAIGAAQMAAGTPKEVAATGLRTLLARLSTQPADTKKALKALGFDPAKIKKQLPEDIFGTVFKLIDKISKAPKAQQAGLLAQLAGMKSFDAFARLLTSTDLMIQALKTVRGEFRLTMQSELIRRVDSLNSAFQITSNLLGDLSDSIVMAWRPQIQWALTKLQELSVSMKDSPILQWTAAIFAGLAGLSLIALPFGILGASIFSSVLGLRALASVLGTALMVARPFLGIIQGLVGGLLGAGRQVALIYRFAGAIAALAASLRLLLAFTGIGAALFAIVAFWPAIQSLATGFWSGLQTGWDGSELQRALQWLVSWLPQLQWMFEAVKNGINFLFDLGSLDGSTLNSLFDGAAAAAQRLLNPLQTIRDIVSWLSSTRVGSWFGGGGQVGANAGANPGDISVPPVLQSRARNAAAGSMAQEAQKASPKGITVQTQGPQVMFKQAPPSISVTNNINVQTNADPGAIGSAAGSATGAAVRRAIGSDGN